MFDQFFPTVQVCDATGDAMKNKSRVPNTKDKELLPFSPRERSDRKINCALRPVLQAQF
jgi:hypothetical protein